MQYVCIPKSWLLPARYEFNHLQLKVAVFNEKNPFNHQKNWGYNADIIKQWTCGYLPYVQTNPTMSEMSQKSSSSINIRRPLYNRIN